MRKKDFDVPRPVADPYQELAVGIVELAIFDWRIFIKRPEAQTPSYNFDEIRRFFKSEWCEFLLEGIGASPKRILEILEGELHDSGLREQN